ncbi:hypothetical protein [Variovorax boronicumulans]|uniref:hypothetical protein n=1 Tax=Variovorax boronicumulans TaxID=436515 RepID=UPI001C5A19D2
MIEPTQLQDEELSQLATLWRSHALRGDLNARGIAHQLETELRRRNGAPFPAFDTLDMRSLESRQRRPMQWRFWRRANDQHLG